MKKILILMLGMFLISFTSAMLYAGETYSFESEEYEYYTIAGNSSNLEGMNVSWENGYTILDFVQNFKPDNFTLIFFNEEKEVIHEYHSSRKTKYVDRNFTEYIDRNITNYVSEYIIEYVNQTDKPLNITNDSNEEKDKKIKFLYLINLILILILVITYSLRVKKSIELKRRLKNE